MTKNKRNIPPKWADNFLEWFCDPRQLEEIQGDLHEVFNARCRKDGQSWARALFVADVLLSVSFKIIETPFYSIRSLLTSQAMFKNYFTIAYRNLLRDKVFSLTNIMGLAIGMAACFMIMQYISFEWSYDQFHVDKDRLYRMTIERDNPTSKLMIAATHPGLGPALKTDFPEVEEYSRLLHQSIYQGAITTWSHMDEHGDQKVFNQERVYNADPSFLTMFSFAFVWGDPRTALNDPSSVVISESTSTKFFGDKNPLGKILVENGRKNLKVTGVFKDIPENSHIKFDLLVSYFFQERFSHTVNDEVSWKWAEFYTYVRLAPGTDPNILESKLDKFVERYLGDYMRRMNYTEHFHLQAITDIHLKSPSLTKEREVHGSNNVVYFLLIAAALTLIIAWINYINLSTSKSVQRAQEVGIRKVTGASKTSLIIQFLFESAIVNFLALAISAFLIAGSLPYFNALTGKNIGNTINELTLLGEPIFWMSIAGVFVFGSFVAGLYPAFVLSSFNIVAVLKGKFFGSRSGIATRKILVGSQFVISVALIAGTIVVFRQVSFMRNQELGYDKDQILIFKSPRVGDSTMIHRLETFQNDLNKISAIQHYASSNEVPGRQPTQSNFIRNYDDSREDQFLTYHFYINKDFLKTFGLNLVAGRGFREKEALNIYTRQENTPLPIVLNERAIQLLGYRSADEAVGNIIYFGLGEKDWPGEVIGVIENHHQQSLKDNYDPILFFPDPYFFGEYMSINMNMQHATGTISSIEKAYKENFPGNQFDYFFLDEYFDRQYAADQRFGKLFGLFSMLAIFIAALGLFGLSTFMISQRSREIAIRKILGATIPGMVALFSKDFIRLTIIANVITLPVVYFTAERWLDNFAFRIPIGWITFIIPLLSLLIISLVTVSIQTIKTGLTNPVKALRSE